MTLTVSVLRRESPRPEVGWLPMPALNTQEGIAASLELLDYVEGDITGWTITVHPSTSLGAGWSLTGTKFQFGGAGIVVSGLARFRLRLDADPTVIRDSGVLAYSSIAAIPADPKPSVPTNPRFTAQSSTGGVFEADAMQYTQYYRAWRNTVPDQNGPGWTEIDAGIVHQTPSFQLSGMTGNEYLRMAAGNASGLSDSTASVLARPLPSPLPISLLHKHMTADNPTPVVLTGTPTGWNAPHPDHGPPPVCSSEQAYEGKYSYKARYTAADAVKKGWSRCEMILPQSADWVTSTRTYPQERWYGFRIYILDFIVDRTQWEIWQQCHRVNDPDDIEAGNPNLSLHTKTGTDQFEIQLIGDSRAVTTDKAGQIYNHFSLGKVVSNTWISFAYHIKWAINDTGYARFYRDRQLVASKEGIVTAINNQFGSNFKIGVYKSGWKFNPSLTDPNVVERTAYYDDIRLLNPTGKGLSIQQCLDLVSP